MVKKTRKWMRNHDTKSAFAARPADEYTHGPTDRQAVDNINIFFVSAIEASPICTYRIYMYAAGMAKMTFLDVPLKSQPLPDYHTS